MCVLQGLLHSVREGWPLRSCHASVPCGGVTEVAVDMRSAIAAMQPPCLLKGRMRGIDENKKTEAVDNSL